MSYNAANNMPTLAYIAERTMTADCTINRISYLDGSFFQGRKSIIHQTLLVVYLFLLQVPNGTISTMTGLSLPTVRNIIKDIYQVMEADLRIEDVQIGGVNSDGQPIVVEIDESKFGKRKYNKGKRVDGVWVVGGVERTPERKVFLLTVPNRNQNTLKLIIDTFVKDGSHVMVDCWKGYKGIDSDPSRNLIVETVNHSKTFRDPKTGACTNTIEACY
ncbi:hypothetical protein G6F29_013453 [Rhizopus arrhizus]|nr:hypothetical protein G6F29_013453 [Rhizopus arrhizus]KAG1256971.1 hypothetical protein G6F65_016095 [Rhizopus arrhizus]